MQEDCASTRIIDRQEIGAFFDDLLNLTIDYPECQVHEEPWISIEIEENGHTKQIAKYYICNSNSDYFGVIFDYSNSSLFGNIKVPQSIDYLANCIK